jgi:SagB-type dehydrogenase family enzyme
MLGLGSKLTPAFRVSGAHLPAMNWREYHEATKHSIESVIRAQQVLDWANMPDPFRHYEGVPVLDLPADPVPPAIPALDVLYGTSGTTSVSDGQAFLSQLFFYSAAISASKRAPSTGDKYALRVNPSSGNLHPTEFHFFTRGLKGWPDGLYHYDPSRHMAEQRGRGEFETEPAGGSAPIVFVLTSIVWREAWKYGERAYRYCLHDIGHAWQALALSARAIGCDHFALGHFVDDNVARTLHLNRDEWPMLIVGLRGKCIPVHEADTGKTVWFGGQANQLSKETIAHPLIDSIHLATKRSGGGSSDPSAIESVPAGSGGIRLSSPA